MRVTRSMKRKKLRYLSSPSAVPLDIILNGSFSEYGYHVPHPIRILRMLVQNLEKPRVESAVEHARARVVSQHALVIEDVDGVLRGGWRLEMIHGEIRDFRVLDAGLRSNSLKWTLDLGEIFKMSPFTKIIIIFDL